MTPQKRNKIIVLISVILVIVLVGLTLRFYKKQPVQQVKQQSPQLEKYYQDCRYYLTVPQTLENGQSTTVSQAFCQVKDDQVTLLTGKELEIQPNDFMISIINTNYFFTPEYFEARNNQLPKDLKITLPQDQVTFCVSYGPVDSTSSLTLLPNIFQPPQLLNKTALACQTLPLNILSPIAVLGKIPEDASGLPFGLSILIPHNPQDPYHTTYTTLHSGFVKVK